MYISPIVSELTCASCGHAPHIAPCNTLIVYKRPGGTPGHQMCLCGHPPIQQRIVVTSCGLCAGKDAEIERLREDLRLSREMVKKKFRRMS